MNPKLLSLLVGVGVVSAGTGVVEVYVPRPGINMATLVDAGIRDCTRRNMSCQTYGAVCPDGGYCRKTSDIAVCTESDGSRRVIMPRVAGADIVDINGWCEADKPATLPEGAAVDVPFDCACRAAVGACRTPNPDGGTNLNVEFGVTMQPGTFGGLGCVPKPCVEIAGGLSSWPSECPLQ